MSRLNIYSKEQIDANVGTSEDAASASGTLWARLKNAVSRIVGLEGADAQNVKLSGNQTIAGTKTMNTSPIVPTTPSTPTGAVNSVYVNDATEGVNNIMHKDGTEYIAGKKQLINWGFNPNTGSQSGEVTVLTIPMYGSVDGSPVIIGEIRYSDSPSFCQYALRVVDNTHINATTGIRQPTTAYFTFRISKTTNVASVGITKVLDGNPTSKTIDSL